MMMLTLPYCEKDVAKPLGAAWNGDTWYLPDGKDPAPLWRWWPADLKTAQPDDSAAPRLTIELVPETAWFSNVRDHVDNATWGRIKKTTFSAAKYACEVCGSRGQQWPVECHEVWHYDDDARRQTLLRTVALCPDCHQVKHIGLAKVRGRLDVAIRHLAGVNGWTIDKAKAYAYEQSDLWLQRSRFDWSLDLSWLNREFGLVIESKRTNGE